LLRIRHRRIDWWAASIQLLGTLWFNRTTLSALLVGIGASPHHHPIWRPDALGSICFLVVGAVCFFAGAVLLLPERTLEAPDTELPPGDAASLPSVLPT
jgi:hypothetical protein